MATTSRSWAESYLHALTAEFTPLADGDRAAAMRAYMKDVAPFFGIAAQPRRAAQKRALSITGPPATDDVAETMGLLWAQPEREFHYAACELFGRLATSLHAGILRNPITELLVTKPWWDTVDSLGTPGITTVVREHPELSVVIDEWSSTDDQWLIRAAIQHQRGRKGDTDIPRVLQLCSDHADDRRFFVSKAIGWALRDLTRLDPAAVAGFLETHPDLPAVARREADRGLARVTQQTARS